VLRSNYQRLELIVVDNGSKDGSMSAIQSSLRDPRVRIIRNATNLGFSRANNAGAKIANGSYLMFLNFDTVVDPDWLTEIIHEMEEDSMLAIVQCKLLVMDQPTILDNVGHYIDTLGLTYFIGRLEQDLGQYDRQEIFAAYGAAFLVRADTFRKLSGFDDDFFFLFEETDLCWRARIAGFKIAYIPRGKVYHKGGASYRESTRDYSTTTYFFVRNRLASLLKNYELENLLKYAPTNVLIMILLALLHATRGKVREAVAVMQGLLWNMWNINATIRKRGIVGRMRRVRDQALLRQGMIRGFDLGRAIDKARS
jgi:GT2 family glycosyltransferase